MSWTNVYSCNNKQMTACHQYSLLNPLKVPYFSLNEVSQYLDG